ncbi:MAG TPA: response regulator [Bryobacteraceae bacterium]
MKPVEILLVEDNAGDAVLMRQVMGESKIPVNLHIARDGEQALIILSDAQFRPDLIILDLNLPRIPGSVVLERYKAGKAPIVVFSSSWNETEIQNALNMGAREFIQKPTDIQEFIDAVCGIIQKWGVRSENGAAGAK